jgi:hypothetical protein
VVVAVRLLASALLRPCPKRCCDDISNQKNLVAVVHAVQSGTAQYSTVQCKCGALDDGVHDVFRCLLNTHQQYQCGCHP